MFLIVGLLGFSSATACYNDKVSIDTFSAQSVGETSALLRGSVYILDDSYEAYTGFAYREDGTSSWYSVAGSFDWYDYNLPSGDMHTYTITGLDPDTAYNFKIIAPQYKIDGTGYSGSCEDGIYFSFTTDPETSDPPTVQTNAVTSITDTTATFNGEVSNMNDASSATPFFGYREEGGSWTYTADLNDITNPSSFFDARTGLTPNTNYEVKAWVDSSLGTSSGSIVYFTTDETSGTTPPTLSLNTVSSFGENYGVLSADVDSLGDYTSADVKFFYKEYGTSGPIAPISASEETVNAIGEVTYNLSVLSQNTEYEYTLGYYDTDLEYYVLYDGTQTFTTLEETFDWINTTKSNETTTGTFSESLTDLDPNTNYSFRACVETEIGLNCNETLTFMTLDLDDPEVNVLNATTITTDGALLKGELTSLGDYSSVEVYFAIDQTGANGTGYETLSGSYQNLTSTGEFDYTVTGLDYNTSYQYTAYAYSPDNYLVGGDDVALFTTLSPSLIPPVENNTLPDINMNVSDNYTYNFDNYYSYYDTITINIENSSLNVGEGVTMVIGGDPSLSLEMYEILDNTFLQLTSHEQNATYTVYYNVSNSEGTLERNFTVTILEGSETTPEPPEEEEEEEVLTGVFGTITNWFLSIFPDSDDMTTSQKIGFMVVAMFIVSLLIVALTFATTKNITMGVMYFILVVNALLFFFFASIGYVPIGFLVVLGITVIILGVFKFKSAFSGGGE